MNGDYNIFFELAILPLDITLYFFLLIKWKNSYSPARFRFRMLTLVITIADAMNILNITLINQYARVPNELHILTHSLDVFFSMCASYEFVQYIYAYIDDEKFKRKGTITNQVIMTIMVLLLIQNIFTENIFSYNDSGAMEKGVLFTMLTYFVPLYFVIHSIVILAVRREVFDNGQWFALVASLIILNVMFIVQILFLLNMPKLTKGLGL